MKKFISLLLALVMVFSMGAVAFADGTTEEAPEKETIAPITIGEILEMAEQIFAGVKWDKILEYLDTTVETVKAMAKDLAPLFEDIFASINPNEVPAQMMNAFVDGLAKMFKTDRQGIIDALLEIPFVKEIMGWYGYKEPTSAPETTTEAPETTTEAPATEAPVVEEEVPNTGAAAGVAVFASLSVAAAAAFVSKKKAA